QPGLGQHPLELGGDRVGGLVDHRVHRLLEAVTGLEGARDQLEGARGVLGSCSSNLAWRRDASTDSQRSGPTVPSTTTSAAKSRFWVRISTSSGGMNADASETSTNSATRMLSPAASRRSRNASSRLPRRTSVSAMAVALPAHSLEPKAVGRIWSSAMAGVSEYGDSRWRSAR